MSDKSILLVEDNPDDEALVMRAIRKHQVTAKVHVAHDGVEALQMLGVEPGNGVEGPLKPTIVFLDLKMPRLGGLEVLRRLRSHQPSRFVPIVVFTSSNEEQDIIESYRLGALSYLRKPVDYVDLARVVGCALEYWLTMNEAAPDTNHPIIETQFAY